MTVSVFILKISFLIWSIFLAFIQAYDVYTYHMSIFFNLNVESKSSIILNNHKIVLQNVLRKGLTVPFKLCMVVPFLLYTAVSHISLNDGSRAVIGDSPPEFDVGKRICPEKENQNQNGNGKF